jgi:hypothetical protein
VPTVVQTQRDYSQNRGSSSREIVHKVSSETQHSREIVLKTEVVLADKVTAKRTARTVPQRESSKQSSSSRAEPMQEVKHKK